MRIAVDARPLATPWNGIGTYLRDLLHAMQTLEQHHWFLYSDRPIPIPVETNGSAQTTTFRSGTLTGSLVSTAYCQWHFSRWAVKDHCDLFWSPRHQLPLRLPASMPAVLSIHDLVFKSCPETMRRSGLLLERLLTPRSLANADTVLSSSMSVYNDICKYFPQYAAKAKVILLSSSLHEHDSANPADLHPKLPKAPYFVFSGSLEPRKNVDRLLAAYETLKAADRIPHQLVLISGGGWHNEQTLSTIKRMAKHVHLYQNITESEKALIFRGADFVALPSLHEGFGIPIAEGIKLGKPALTSSTASMPEVAGTAGEYVNPEDVDSIAGAIHRLCTDTSHREKLAANAKLIANHYSWKHCAELTLNAFKGAVR